MKKSRFTEYPIISLKDLSYSVTRSFKYKEFRAIHLTKSSNSLLLIQVIELYLPCGMQPKGFLGSLFL